MLTKTYFQFSRSCIGGSTVLSTDFTCGTEKPTDRICQPNRTDLCFESRFESGNLGKAIKITDTYYQLHLRHDMYTQRHMQWYYFRISNTRSGTMYRLFIIKIQTLCKLCLQTYLKRIGYRVLTDLLYREHTLFLFDYTKLHNCLVLKVSDYKECEVHTSCIRAFQPELTTLFFIILL